MAAQALPLLAAAGAVLLLSGGKKRKKGPSSGQKCDPKTKPPEGFLCEDGFLKQEAVDESELDSDGDLSKEDVGDFETEEEDVTPQDGEESGDASDLPPPEPDAKKTCEEFMEAVHVVPSDENELPINSVAVEESVLPAMRSNAEALAQNLGKPLDPESVGPVLVVRGLQALVPVCDWKYNPDEDEFTYDNGNGIDSDIAKDVLYGLIKISLSVIEEINAPETKTATFQAQG